MLNVSAATREAIISGLAENTLIIRVYNALSYDTITEDNIAAESMEIKQSVCDKEKLTFGGAVASEFTIKLIGTENLTFAESESVNNVIQLEGKTIEVMLYQQYIGGQLYPSSTVYPSSSTLPGGVMNYNNWVLFYGKVKSCERDVNDERIFTLTAYDPINELQKLNVSRKLKTAMANGQATINQLLALAANGISYNINEYRTSLLSFQLRDYAWEDEKQNNSNKTKLYAQQLLRLIGEVNSGFAFYRPSDRSLHFTYIGNTVCGAEDYDVYESMEADFKVNQNYVGLLFPYAGEISDRGQNGWGKKTGYFEMSGSTEIFTEVDDSFSEAVEVLAYNMSDNILAWDYSNSSGGGQGNLTKIRAVFTQYQGDGTTTGIDVETDYVPMTLKVDARPWVEVGDVITVKRPARNIYGEFLDVNGNVTEKFEDAKMLTYKTRVLSRTMKGIKSLTDIIEAKGMTV